MISVHTRVRSVSAPLAMMLAITFCTAARAQVAPAAPPSSESVQFESLDTKLPSGGIKLANGKPITNLSDWKSIAIAEEPGSTTAKPLFCTATLIGPRIIVTAAHCVWSTAAQSQKSVTLMFTYKPYTVVGCEIPAAFKTDGAVGQDYAFCELNDVVAGVRPETLVGSELIDHQTITLMGYGCSQKYIDANNKKVVIYDPKGARLLRHGLVDIYRTSVGGAPDAPGPLALVLSPPNKPTLCPGDSGGPAWLGMSVVKPAEGRVFAALNVRESQGPTDETGTSWYSYLLPLGAFEVRTALKKWVSNRLQVCWAAEPDLGKGVDCRT